MIDHKPIRDDYEYPSEYLKGLEEYVMHLQGENKRVSDLNMEMAISSPAFYPMKEEIKTLKNAIKNIIKHMEIVAGDSVQMSTVYRIAKKALK